jgi:hypothetical protein
MSAGIATDKPSLPPTRWHGIDFHVLMTLLFRGWSILAGAATVLIIPFCLTPVTQGYYYTFASILALQVFFELGLSQILVQLASHEVAHLTPSSDGLSFDGDVGHLDRLASLVRMMRRWYGVAALLFVAGCATMGIVFFLRKGGTLPLGSWLGPWLLLVAASGANLYLSPNLAILEGMGRVGQVARLRLVQACVGNLVLWIALASGLGLWATAAVPLAASACTGFWLRTRSKSLGALARRAATAAQRILWRRDVFPFQWRIALSWISGYFIVSFFTPLVFSQFGAVEAGRLGMALTIFNALSTIGMSWVNAKAPNFAMHIARGERQDLNRLFQSVAIRSNLATILLAIGAVVAVWLLSKFGLSTVKRIAPLPVLVCLAWVTIVNSVIFAAAVFMRAHREEPMLGVSVVTALLTASAAWYGSRYGVFPLMICYASVGTFVALPWTLVLFKRYANRTS